MNRPSLQVTFRKGRPLVAYLYLPRPKGARVARTIEVRANILVDYDARGNATGVEFTAPAETKASTIRRVLREIGARDVTAEDLAPLRAA